MPYSVSRDGGGQSWANGDDSPSGSAYLIHFPQVLFRNRCAKLAYRGYLTWVVVPSEVLTSHRLTMSVDVGELSLPPMRSLRETSRPSVFHNWWWFWQPPGCALRSGVAPGRKADPVSPGGAHERAARCTGGCLTQSWRQALLLQGLATLWGPPGGETTW
jgi:hypothetical protein